MIIVHGTFPLKDDLREDALRIMHRVAVATRSELGCISYEFYIGLSDRNTILLFQEWESVEALHDHLGSQHMDEFLRDIPSMLDGHVSTRRYEVRATEKSSIDKQEFETGSGYETYRKIIH